MKRSVGIFLIISAILNYLIMDTLTFPIEERITMRNLNSGVSTVSTVTYSYPTMYWVVFAILIIIFILGLYFILAKDKHPEECTPCDTSENTNDSTQKI